jgi:hypothetical protein
MARRGAPGFGWLADEIQALLIRLRGFLRRSK